MSVDLMQRDSYVVVLEQFLPGTTVTSEPIESLDEAYKWIAAFGVCGHENALSGDVYSDGSAVIGRWTISQP